MYIHAYITIAIYITIYIVVIEGFLLLKAKAVCPMHDQQCMYVYVHTIGLR